MGPLMTDLFELVLWKCSYGAGDHVNFWCKVGLDFILTSQFMRVL